MIVLEYKIKAKQYQLQAIDKAIRTSQFVRNKALRYWMDNKGVSKYDLNKYCRVLAKEFAFANNLNSTARQSSAERAWSSIARFFDNCKKRRDPASPSGARERPPREHSGRPCCGATLLLFKRPRKRSDPALCGAVSFRAA